MIIQDELYGTFEIEPVLEELLKSNAIQRLHGVHQGGASYLVNSRWNLTRYEHSVGVMLLVRTLGGSLEEQIAGLLHDVSHTAFSHVVDFVTKNQDESYHEDIFLSVIESSTIPTILKKYGYNDYSSLLDDSNWRILEQPAPHLCADRIDYTLRDLHRHGTITDTEVQQILTNLTVEHGVVAFKDTESAELFVELYYKEVIDYFMDPLNIYANDQLTKVLRGAVQGEVINMDDFMGTDEELLSKVRENGNEKLIDTLHQIHSNVHLETTLEKSDIYRKNKVRMIDPAVKVEGTIKRASEVSKIVENMNEQAYERTVKGVGVRILL
ncbi:HD domain-containing protein [Halalkalibacillus halophilus]|uniref:HD domain-containing protein n=1 Tax=Halalkalibacillus halophilus TaxID=392827 RepID=UPI0003FA48B0|nr:HD domain-containing protein [Halalkalibacillus halophilus]